MSRRWRLMSGDTAGAVRERVVDEDGLVAQLNFPLVVEVAVRPLTQAGCGVENSDSRGTFRRPATIPTLHGAARADKRPYARARARLSSSGPAGHGRLGFGLTGVHAVSSRTSATTSVRLITGLTQLAITSRLSPAAADRSPAARTGRVLRRSARRRRDACRARRSRGSNRR